MGAWIEKVHSSRGLTQMIERGMSRRTTSANSINGAQPLPHPVPKALPDMSVPKS